MLTVRMSKLSRYGLSCIDADGSTGLVSQPNVIQELVDGIFDLQSAHHRFFGFSR
jgi:hypothetical protein